MGADRRIGYIDGLRGVAVLSVLLYHFWRAYPSRIHGPLALALNSGRHGVELFFVLSGFCLSYPTLAALDVYGTARFDVAKFAARRLVRIVPPYYAAIVCCLVITSLWGKVTYTPADVLRQALFLDRGTTLLNASFWTLPIEFRWYFLFPVALLVSIRWPRFLYLAVLALPLTWAMNVANDDMLYLPCFLLGIVAADVSLRRPAIARYAALALLPLLYEAFAVDAKLGVLGGFNPVWIVLPFCAVVAIGQSSLARRVFAMQWIVAVGVASYSIYLVHQPIIDTLQAHGFAPGIAIAFALAGGFAFWACAERPFVYTKTRTVVTEYLHDILERFARKIEIGDGCFWLHRRQIIDEPKFEPTASLL